MQTSRQFSTKRLFALTAIVAIVAALFSWLPWMWALLALVPINGACSLAFFISRKVRLGTLAFATAALILAGLFFTDWGFSRPNGVVRPFWPLYIAGGIAQAWAIVAWLFDAPLQKENHRPEDCAP